MIRILSCWVIFLTLISSFIGLPVGADETRIALPEGWSTKSPRQEIAPEFSYTPQADGTKDGSLGIHCVRREQHGWFEKVFPVTGGQFVRFQVQRKSAKVETPRRSAIVRIVWQDAQGKSVLSDVPPDHEQEDKAVPIAEPEHPLDGPTDEAGWTNIEETYRVPSRATHATIELHLQWSAGGSVQYREISLHETTPPPPRKVRLATIHYVPSGKSPQENCKEYASLIAEAAKRQADLVVLGETIPYVGVGKKPHETAEKVPGPTTEYFGKLAKQNQLHLVACLYEREERAVFNTAVLLGPDGKLIGKYRKVCLPHSEIEAGVTPGEEYPVFQTSLGKIGMMICYDGFFPEVARELTNRGAEVIAWPVWGCNPLLAQARACENHVYLVSSTYTDSKSDWMISAVFDHAGKPIAKAEKWGEVAVAEVDLSQRYFWRNNLGDFHAMAQRHRPPPAKQTDEQ